MSFLIVLVAQWAILLVLAGALLTWLRAEPRARLELLVAGVVGALLVVVAVKGAGLVWADPRPFVVDGQAPLFPHPADQGFPSDHTTLTAAVGGIVLAFRRVWGAGLLVLSALIGVARVAAHVHHVPDIIGGFLIGLVCAAAAVALARVVADRVEARRSINAWGMPQRRAVDPAEASGA